MCGTRNFHISTNESVHLLPATYNDTNLGIIEPYRSNTNCFYAVTTSTTYRLVVRIYHFDLEDGFDFLFIGYGDNPSDSSSILAKLTGTPKLRALTSLDNHVWFSFITDASGIASGYSINVTRISYGVLQGRIHLLHISHNASSYGYAYFDSFTNCAV